jgi:hypothetical protein
MYTTSQQTRESNTVKHREPTHASLLSGLEPCCYYNPDLRREISFACIISQKKAKTLLACFNLLFYIDLFIYMDT